MGNKNVPELRFPGFEDRWEENKLGENATFSKGKGLSKDDMDSSGNTSCIRYGELYTRYKEQIKIIFSKTNVSIDELIISKKYDLIIPASGETAIDLATASCVIDSGIALGGDINIIRTKMNNIFLAYNLNNKNKFNIARLAQGSSVIHLYSKHLNILNILYPVIDEQNKIASFLTSVDTKIDLLTKKEGLMEQYKKGIMQKIFSQEIRFKDDNGNDYPDWEDKNEPIKIISGNNYSLDLYSDSGNLLIQGFNISPGELSLENPIFISSKLTNKDIIINNGDILLALNRPITNNRLKVCIFNLDTAVLYQRAGILKFNVENIDSLFLYQYISSEYFMRKLTLELVGSDQPYIKSNLFDVTKNIFPIYKEQQKIATFLSSIDTKIGLIDKELESVKMFKKGLLQKMFV